MFELERIEALSVSNQIAQARSRCVLLMGWSTPGNGRGPDGGDAQAEKAAPSKSRTTALILAVVGATVLCCLLIADVSSWDLLNHNENAPIVGHVPCGWDACLSSPVYNADQDLWTVSLSDLLPDRTSTHPGWEQTLRCQRQQGAGATDRAETRFRSQAGNHTQPLCGRIRG